MRCTMLVYLGYGFLMAFIGFMTPAMLNMTTVRTSIEKGKHQGILFGLGAAIINAAQSLVAFLFIRAIDNNPGILDNFKKIGVFVLFSLAIFFYNKSKKMATSKAPKEDYSSFLQGMFMSSINMLAIPYYAAGALGLEAGNQITAEAPFVYYLSAGVLMGGFMMFSIYAIAAKSISEKSEFVTKNLNLILAVFFLFLSLFVLSSILM